VCGSPWTTAKFPASEPLAVRVPARGGRCLPEKTRYDSGGNAPSITDIAGSSRYSVPVAMTPIPTVPTQSSMPVYSFMYSSSSTACAA
jgi:hypothetical protein